MDTAANQGEQEVAAGSAGGRLTGQFWRGRKEGDREGGNRNVRPSVLTPTFQSRAASQGLISSCFSSDLPTRRHDHRALS